MSTSTSRVLQLLELLQTAGTRSVGELAERLDVDERTVRRYVGHLRELEIPVETVRGRYGGYRIAAGLRMPPLMLSDDEALAVVLGLLHAQSSPAASTTAMQTAMSKVRRSLPAESARKLGVLLSTAAFADDRDVFVPDAGILLTAAEAVRRRQPIELRYRSRDGEPSKRTVHPYDLIAFSGRWYLVAFDVGRGAERRFRLDRIATARTVSGTFAPPKPRDQAAATRLVDDFAGADYAWHVKLRVNAGREHIRAHLPASVARLEPLLDDGSEGAWHRVEINAASLEWLPPVIIALGCPVIVDQPAELRTLIADVASRLRDIAASP
ncbi:helix-turn-helix transcriptional regulator [Paramicrobacterium agarici]|uniref:Putative DNA-binding transcriptional regulator YafY n=1 Tax=Paramicrobacterium agarici TaxID=630514 RepID=A0A2A9DTH6_9MICO|nr:YafY family protein [Microbacterium agarici]PFG29998.1 putative DNA-binding transcriptional regulator YafY [Microbacterium agarici]